MRQSVLAEGGRAGLLLGLFVLLMAVLGLAPAFATVPELPLVGLALAVPVVGYALSGCRAAHRAGRVVAGPLAGALAGAISGVVAGLAYLVLDQVFFASVSRQPEKVLNFQRSGLATMRAYLLTNDVRNIGVGLVLGLLGGAFLGLVGAWLSTLGTRRSPQAQ
jgi:hypothetical protein